MSIIDYKESLKIAANDYSFRALIMAAMRKADTRNITLLRTYWPEIWEELYELYNTPGILEGRRYPCDMVDEL